MSPVSSPRSAARRRPQGRRRSSIRPREASPVPAGPPDFQAAIYDPTPVEFATLGLDPRLLEALEHLSFTRTTPIQSAVFPIVFSGADLVACAQTGTGKTAAFLLPLMQRILQHHDRLAPRTVRMLVLAPTRELAVQIEEDFLGFSYHTPITSVVVYGGVPMEPQSRALEAGVELVVATPGRLLDHMNSGLPRFESLEVLVLDEADRMLDMGFWPDVRRIVSALPVKRQTLLFSATMSRDVLGAASQIMREPKMVQIGPAGGPASTISHYVKVVAHRDRDAWLTEYLRRVSGPTLVFVSTKIGTDRLARKLAAGHVRCTPLHADLSQPQRLAAVEGFRSGRYRVLVATDVAARGLDIERIAQVVNYELPGDVDSYVHRVGRTGRAEAVGRALTLVSPSELPLIRALEKRLDVTFSPVEAPAEPLRRHPPAEATDESHGEHHRSRRIAGRRRRPPAKAALDAS